MNNDINFLLPPPHCIDDKVFIRLHMLIIETQKEIDTARGRFVTPITWSSQGHVPTGDPSLINFSPLLNYTPG